MSEEEKGIFHGPLHSDVAGRTDHLPLHTGNGAYVIPACAVSHLGENNTMAGFKVLKRAFKGIPYGQSGAPYGPPLRAPYGDQLQNKASGGRTRGAVPVVVAGGGYVVSPEEVARLGGGGIHVGHAVLDKFVDYLKKEHIKTLKALPGPKKG